MFLSFANHPQILPTFYLSCTHTQTQSTLCRLWISAASFMDSFFFFLQYRRRRLKLCLFVLFTSFTNATCDCHGSAKKRKGRRKKKTKKMLNKPEENKCISQSNKYIHIILEQLQQPQKKKAEIKRKCWWWLWWWYEVREHSLKKYKTNKKKIINRGTNRNT